MSNDSLTEAAPEVRRSVHVEFRTFISCAMLTGKTLSDKSRQPARVEVPMANIQPTVCVVFLKSGYTGGGGNGNASPRARVHFWACARH